MTGIKQLADFLKRNMLKGFGGQIPTPKFSTTASANTPSAGNIIYCIKPLGGDATIASAKDQNGIAITALANITISKGDEYKEFFSEITFTDTTVVRLYEMIKDDRIFA